MTKIVEKTIYLDDGRTITIETGKLAKQADGAVVVRMGKTMLLATVVSAKEAKEFTDFLPLSVEYKETYASMGKFPGNFLRREGRPGDNEILVSRLVDRALRPMFPKDYHADTYVNISLISGDRTVMPDSLAALAASSAICVSDVPFKMPISEVRVVKVNGDFIINPNFSDAAKADIDIMVAATKDSIVMVEGEMNEASENEILYAIKLAHEAIKMQCQAQLDLVEMKGVVEKRKYCHEKNDEDLKELIRSNSYDKIYDLAKSKKSKKERNADFSEIKKELLDSYAENEAQKPLVEKYLHETEKEAVRNLILNEKVRIDGRNSDEIRPIWCEVDYLPSSHGSAVFTRGETQALASVTLGTKSDEKIIDDVFFQKRERFLLHYNFPAFSTGDARPYRGVGRREVGHGNLAYRAIKKMLPSIENNPYAIRIVSDILESNGSSSMATVCASTLALLDAGIRMKKPVSGIAMGLIVNDKNNKYSILSDILGDEDHLGDMDFKVTGTMDGITACQMDIKVDGISYELLAEALNQAKTGRIHILNKILETIPGPREDYKPNAPRIEKLVIKKEMIGALIGPGGKIIQQIQADTGASITIDEMNGQGFVDIVANNKESVDAALKAVISIVEVPEVGKVYKGRVKSIVSFGAFIEILPGKDGLLHISEIEWRRLKSVEEVLKEGDYIEVKLIEIDRRTNKLKLSRKILLPRPDRRYIV